MTLLKIATIGHPLLRERSREVSLQELGSAQVQTLIDDLIETMRDASGAGIAAPQCYRLLRICVIEVKGNPRYPHLPDIPLLVLVNPVITPLSPETFDNYEGCLSVPNLRGLVARHTHVKLAYTDRAGQPIEREVRGLAACILQHECDHLDGTLFVDRVKDPRSLTTLADYERFHRGAFIDSLRGLLQAEASR